MSGRVELFRSIYGIWKYKSNWKSVGLEPWIPSGKLQVVWWAKTGTAAIEPRERLSSSLLWVFVHCMIQSKEWSSAIPETKILLSCGFFFFLGDAAIARLSKIQKKKRCIFIMATVSKEQTYICGFGFLWQWEIQLRGGFLTKKKKNLVLLVVHKRIVCAVGPHLPLLQAPQRTEHLNSLYMCWAIHTCMFAADLSREPFWFVPLSLLCEPRGY